MAVVKAFRGVRYNPAQLENIQQVVSQPYDKIDGDFQGQYYQLNPYNIVRIILGKTEPGDDPARPDGPNVYTRAKAYYQDWMKKGILKREEQPAFYVYEQTFHAGGQPYTRLGLIAAVELTDFDEGTILPHEKTHAGPKEDRLRLLKTMQANTEQIFILYPDSANDVNALLRQEISRRPPDLDVVEIFENDVRQCIWKISDPVVIKAVEDKMAEKRGLIIADGHHRYGTGLNYRNTQRQTYPDAPRNAAFNFVQATLVSMTDPGLVVLPTHREICNFTATSTAAILEHARQHFNIEAISNLQDCLARVNTHPQGHAFGFYGGPQTGFQLLTLKNLTLAEQLITDDHSPAWKALAVSVLHKILLEQIAQVPVQGIEDKSMIRYHRDPQTPVDNINAGQGNFVFFVSATRMEQIKEIAGHGEIMPQKSTDFYPKMISGLTLLPLDPDERL
ncbi:MAG: DUF1015 domain-containing protein [Chloroflexi bacterium]|nr:DUF1015 domain-containing protein [Chloroflexota bacterium]